MALSGHTMLATYRQTIYNLQNSRGNAIHAQQHPASSSYIDVTLIRAQRDFAHRRSPTRVLQNHVVEIAKTAGIGREDPECLGQVVPLERATAFRAGLRADANQHAVRHRMPNDVRAMTDGRHRRDS